MRRAVAVLVALVVALCALTGSVGAQTSDDAPPAKVEATTSTTTGLGSETFGGAYPPAAYVVRGKTDAAKPDETFYTVAARGFFDAARAVSQLAMGAIRWAWQFTLADTLAPVVAASAAVTQQRIVGPFGLIHLALFFLAIYFGFLVLSGRLIHGIGEVVMSMLCMVLAGAIALHPVAFFTGATSLLKEVSTALSTRDGVQSDDGSKVLTGGLQRGLIADPWEWLSFGHVITGTKCAEAVDVALAPDDPNGGGGIIGKAKDAAGKVVGAAVDGVIGPGADAVQKGAQIAGTLTFKSGVDGDVSKKLDDLDCPAEKAAYENPSGDKVFGAFLLLVASLIVAALSLSVVFAVTLAQLVFALLAVLAPLAVVAAILPGPGRDLWWRYCALGAKSFLAAVTGCYLLAITLGFIDGILSLSSGLPMELRMLLIVALPIAALMFRKKLAGGLTRLTGRGVGKLGSLAPSSNAWATHTMTASTGSAMLGMMGADPDYSYRQQGRSAVARGQAAIRSKPGQLTIAAATGGASAVASTAVGAKAATIAGARAVGQRVGARMMRPDGTDPATPDAPELLALSRFAGRDRPPIALPAGPQGRFTMPPRPGDAAPRAGALPAAPPAAVGELGPGAGNRRTRPRRNAEAAPHPAGYRIEQPAAPPEVVYHPDPASARVRSLPDGGPSAAAWDRQAFDRVLRIHEGFHAAGRDEPLRLAEIDETMPTAHRRRVEQLSADLWNDEAVATNLAGRGHLGIARQSAEERHWIRSADFTRPAEMRKLRAYHAEGRLRFKGHGPVPADESIHRYAAEVYGNRPLP